MADDPDVSSSAFDLRALSHGLNREQEGTVEREAYLEKLRKKIKAGEYHVNAENLADKLLDSAADEILPGHCPDEEDDAK